ncbi:MAG TPA: SH3 domain-containing protein [Chitinophagales bacterium]|nr:SH3 domain-containing protein [Chitinophagales bacterium]
MKPIKNVFNSFVVWILSLNIGNTQACLGHTTAQLNLRTDPSTESPIINKISQGALIFIEDTSTTYDGFYYILDIMSNNYGFASTKYIKVDSALQKSPDRIFSPLGRSRSYNPSVAVKDSTNLEVTLKLNNSVYIFQPGETRTLELPPGKYTYVASAPGVLPYFGDDLLEANYSYYWTFYVVTVRR